VFHLGKATAAEHQLRRFEQYKLTRRPICWVKYFATYGTFVAAESAFQIDAKRQRTRPSLISVSIAFRVPD
jgi:hypothetical protein